MAERSATRSESSHAAASAAAGRVRRAARLVAVAAFVVALAACGRDGGAGATIRAARIVAGAAPVLEADVDLALSPTMREALDRGIALDLTVRLEGRSAAGADALVERRVVRLRYLPLANQYQVLDVARGTARQFASRAQLFAALDQVRLVLGPEWRAFARDGALRLQLGFDSSVLPGPLRLPALFDREWQFAAADHRWRAAG